MTAKKKKVHGYQLILRTCSNRAVGLCRRLAPWAFSVISLTINTELVPVTDGYLQYIPITCTISNTFGASSFFPFFSFFFYLVRLTHPPTQTLPLHHLSSPEISKTRKKEREKKNLRFGSIFRTPRKFLWHIAYWPPLPPLLQCYQLQGNQLSRSDQLRASLCIVSVPPVW